jgi:ABC-2 type transport system permease protein
MNQKLYTVWVFFITNFKRIFRDKTALFFTFLFPLIFLFVFGGMFGKERTVEFNIALINQSSTEFSKDFVKELKKQSNVDIKEEFNDLKDAQVNLTRGQLDVALVLPKDFGKIKNDYPTGEAKIFYTNNSASAGSTFESIMNTVFQDINKEILQTESPFTVTSEELNLKSLSPFDYTFAGLIGFAILGTGIFGPMNVFPELKKQGILRRLHTTTIRPWQYFVSVMLGNAVIGLMSISLMFFFGYTVFDLNVTGNLLELAVFLAFGIVMILGIGLSIGGWAKNERQAAPLGNMIVFPMMFLSGTFFPRFLMPDWLQKISSFFPLTPVIEGARLITTEGQHLTSLGTELGIMLVWAVIIYSIAFRVFKWE